MLPVEPPQLDVRFVPDKFVPKSWGWENWLHNDKDSNYCLKQLFIKAGQKTSIHRHPVKDEAIHCHSGVCYIACQAPPEAPAAVRTHAAAYGPFIYTIKPGQTVHIKAGAWHCLHAKEDTLLYEGSTFHSDDDVERRDSWKEEDDVRTRRQEPDPDTTQACGGE